jgi:hypothetical protein
MNHIHTHPQPEKVQIKYHNQNPDLTDTRDVKRTVSLINKKSDFTNLQQDFRMKEEATKGDLQRDFEIEYEQFLINIRGPL